MKKIKRVSKYFMRLFQLAFIIQPIMLAYVAFGFISQPFYMLNGIVNTSSYHINILQEPGILARILGIVILSMTTLLTLYTLYLLIKLFRNFSHGKVFSRSNIKTIKYIAYMMFIGQLLIPIQQILLSYVLTSHNPIGQRQIAISFGSNNIETIIIAFIMILVAWIMGEAYRLYEEQKLTV